jgi:hypothetical protein
LHPCWPLHCASRSESRKWIKCQKAVHYHSCKWSTQFRTNCLL